MGWSINIQNAEITYRIRLLADACAIEWNLSISANMEVNRIVMTSNGTKKLRM